MSKTPFVKRLTGILVLGIPWMFPAMVAAQSQERKIDLPPSLVGVKADGLPYGTTAGDDVGAAEDDLGDIFPGSGDTGTELVFPRTRFATNGISLRNCRQGGINLVGIPPGSTIVAAYLYWAWTGFTTPVPGLHDTMRIVRRWPRPRAGGLLTGALVGTGADPCWTGGSNFVYRADVLAQLPAVVTGSGTYGVMIRPAAAGAVDYSDPWGFPGPVAPLLEGASLVVVYENQVEPMGTTHLYDMGLSGFMFFSFPGITYNLVGLVPATVEARWANIGADGQTGAGYVDTLEIGHDSTFLLNTGMPIAGGGPFGFTSAYMDSDWNGSGNKPLGQLWDTSGHDVTQSLVGFPTLPVAFMSPGAGAIADCLVPVANVVWTR